MTFDEAMNLKKGDLVRILEDRLCSAGVSVGTILPFEGIKVYYPGTDHESYGLMLCYDDNPTFSASGLWSINPDKHDLLELVEEKDNA